MASNDRFRNERTEGPVPARASVPRSQGRPQPQPMSTLHAGQGAEVTTRKNAAHAADLARLNAEKRFRKRHAQEISSGKLHADAARARRDGGSSRQQAVPEGPERTNKNIVLLVAAAILVLVLLFLVVRCATGLSKPADQGASDDQGQEQVLEPQQSEQDADGTVKWNGTNYTVGQDADGSWAVYAASEGATPAEVCRLDGTPSGILLCHGILVIPESLSDGWDVLAYMPADGSLPTKVANPDGTPVTGSGSIESAVLDGSNVVVTDSTGAKTTVALE